MSVAAEINAKVTSVLAEALVVDEDDITPTAALQRDLGADSLDLLEITFVVEASVRGELRVLGVFCRMRSP